MKKIKSLRPYKKKDNNNECTFFVITENKENYNFYKLFLYKEIIIKVILSKAVYAFFIIYFFNIDKALYLKDRKYYIVHIIIIKACLLKMKFN